MQMHHFGNKTATGTLRLQSKSGNFLKGINDVLSFNDKRNANGGSGPGGAGASTQTVIPQKTSKFNFDSIYNIKENAEEEKGNAKERQEI